MNDDHIFVFGSNLAGRHGKGAALTARKDFGAVYGVGYGRTGNAYAIPTKDEKLITLPLSAIQAWCFAFIEYANAHPNLKFYVTPIGCGLAGYKRAEIVPFLYGMPENCKLAETWFCD